MSADILQLLIVFLLLAWSVGFIARRLLVRKTPSCDSGCSRCGGCAVPEDSTPVRWR